MFMRRLVKVLMEKITMLKTTMKMTMKQKEKKMTT